MLNKISSRMAVIWGAGRRGMLCAEKLTRMNCKIKMYVDSNRELDHKIYEGGLVCRYYGAVKEELRENGDFLFVISPASNEGIIDEVKDTFPETPYIVYDELMEIYRGEMNTSRDMSWKIDYEHQSRLWADSLLEEVQYFHNQVYAEGGCDYNKAVQTDRKGIGAWFIVNICKKDDFERRLCEDQGKCLGYVIRALMNNLASFDYASRFQEIFKNELYTLTRNS